MAQHQYYAGIPSSLISYSSERGRLQTYDNIYDLPDDTTALQVQELREELTELNQRVVDLATIKSGFVADYTNYVANGDFSQYSLPWPQGLTSNTVANAQSHQMQGRTVPIFDRWYHYAELAGLNPAGFKCEVSRDLISNNAPTVGYGAFPINTKYCARLRYYNADNANAMGTLEHNMVAPNGNAFGAMLGIQHTCPEVRQFVSREAYLSFWVHNNKGKDMYCHVMRQYWPTGVGALHTDNALETIYLQSFSTIPGAWKFITIPLTFPALRYPILDGIGNNGLVIQIGPLHYFWGGGTNINIYGDASYFTLDVANGGGLDVRIAEVQLRFQSTVPEFNSFPITDESRRTLPYVSYSQFGPPETIRASGNYATPLYFPVTAVERVGSTFVGPNYNSEHYVYSSILLSSSLLKPPTDVYLVGYTKPANSPFLASYLKIGANFMEHNQPAEKIWGNNVLSVAKYDAWPTGLFQSVTDVNIIPWRAGTRVPTENSFTYFTGVDVPNVTLANLAEYCAARFTLRTSSSGTMDAQAYFVALIRETPDDTRDMGQTEVLTLVDHSFTALTTRKFIPSNN